MREKISSHEGTCVGNLPTLLERYHKKAMERESSFFPIHKTCNEMQEKKVRSTLHHYLPETLPLVLTFARAVESYFVRNQRGMMESESRARFPVMY